MNAQSPFDHERDAALGAALREALTPSDHAAFVARVLAGVPEVRTWWEVLGTWARPGLAAAAVLAAVAALWLGKMTLTRTAASETVLDDPLGGAVAASSTTALLVAQRPPDVDVILAAANGH